MRLQKYLAHCGVASRRKSEELIRQGSVSVNGEVITEMGYKVVPEKDEVTYQGRVVVPEEEKIYIMLNKPEGVITSADDQFSRKTVLDFVSTEYRIYPIGRLDYDTSGLILLTNDGNFANEMMHPKFKVPKKYHALVRERPNEEELQAFQKGLQIEDYFTAPASIRILENHSLCLLEIIIHEGRNRQVRKMCDAIGHPVIKLKRVAIGDLSLGRMKEGEWRRLSEDEIKGLLRKQR